LNLWALLRGSFGSSQKSNKKLIKGQFTQVIVYAKWSKKIDDDLAPKQQFKNFLTKN
jgi:hypothetical protein